MQRNKLVNWANSLGFDASTIPNDSKLEAHLKYLQNNGTAVSGTLATQTITASDSAVADETITIGDITYTWVSALSEAKATGTLTSTGTNVSEGDTVTIEGVTYTFQATPTGPYSVDIGADAATSLDNLKAAINDSGTEGTTYGTGTVAHPKVTATTNSNTQQVVEAKNFGTYANSYLTSEDAAELSWGATSLEGGVDPVPFEIVTTGTAATELDAFKAAVNDSGTEGTTYSTGTYAHPQVTATTNSATQQVVAARDYTISAVATTEDMTQWAWSAGTLASGVLDKNAVSASSVAQDGLGQNANV